MKARENVFFESNMSSAAIVSVLSQHKVKWKKMSIDKKLIHYRVTVKVHDKSFIHLTDLIC